MHRARHHLFSSLSLIIRESLRTEELQSCSDHTIFHLTSPESMLFPLFRRSMFSTVSPCPLPKYSSVFCFAPLYPVCNHLSRIPRPPPQWKSIWHSLHFRHHCTASLHSSSYVGSTSSNSGASSKSLLQET